VLLLHTVFPAGRLLYRTRTGGSLAELGAIPLIYVLYFPPSSLQDLGILTAPAQQPIITTREKGARGGVVPAVRQSGALAFLRRLLFQNGLGERGGRPDGRPDKQASGWMDGWMDVVD